MHLPPTRWIAVVCCRGAEGLPFFTLVAAPQVVVVSVLTGNKLDEWSRLVAKIVSQCTLLIRDKFGHRRKQHF